MGVPRVTEQPHRPPEVQARTELLHPQVLLEAPLPMALLPASPLPVRRRLPMALHQLPLRTAHHRQAAALAAMVRALALVPALPDQSIR